MVGSQVVLAAFYSNSCEELQYLAIPVNDAEKF
jgi:hypothetical protein